MPCLMALPPPQVKSPDRPSPAHQTQHPPAQQTMLRRAAPSQAPHGVPRASTAQITGSKHPHHSLSNQSCSHTRDTSHRFTVAATTRPSHARSRSLSLHCLLPSGGICLLRSLRRQALAVFHHLAAHGQDALLGRLAFDGESTQQLLPLVVAAHLQQGTLALASAMCN